MLTEENARLNSEVTMLTGDSNALAAANIRIGNLTQENDTLINENQ